MKVQGANGFSSNTVEGELFCQILCFFFFSLQFCEFKFGDFS